MREIKFDAIYKPTGEHFEPYKIDFRDNTTFGNFDGEQNDWCHFSLDGKRGDAILRQYTGLKDKNGAEIYEGDILECHHKTKGNVFFHDGSYSLSSDQCEFDLDDIQSYDSLNQYLIEDNNLIVIGNIHENPGLLES